MGNKFRNGFQNLDNRYGCDINFEMNYYLMTLYHRLPTLIDFAQPLISLSFKYPSNKIFPKSGNWSLSKLYSTNIIAFSCNWWRIPCCFVWRLGKFDELLKFISPFPFHSFMKKRPYIQYLRSYCYFCSLNSRWSCAAVVFVGGSY